MNPSTARIALAGVAIAFAAVITLAAEALPRTPPVAEPAVPPASTVFHANDGRGEGNPEDKTY
jgi:hypothetical protein